MATKRHSMGVLGAPLSTSGATQVPEPPIYGKMVVLPVLSMLTMGSSYKTAPIRFFKFVWGLPAVRY
jgi:hypothetical protein